jgi:hypothetical protein
MHVDVLRYRRVNARALQTGIKDIYGQRLLQIGYLGTPFVGSKRFTFFSSLVDFQVSDPSDTENGPGDRVRPDSPRASH